MQLLIHGGHYKTGTTAFQQWLHASRSRLSQIGAFVPDPGAHDNHGFALNMSIRGARRDDSLWQTLTAAAAEGHTFAIISAETIANHDQEDFDAFYARARKFDPVFFLVLRHWHDFLPSRHAQNLRRGDWLGLPDFLDRMEVDFEKHPDANFGLPFARAHTAGFRNMIAVDYRRDGALETLARLTGISRGRLEGGQLPDPAANARSDPAHLERLRLINGVIGTAKGFEAGHTYRSNMNPKLKIGFLLLTDIVARLEQERPEFIARLDAEIELRATEVVMADRSSLFGRWRESIKRTFADTGTQDWIGDFTGPRTPPVIRTSLVRHTDLDPELQAEIRGKIARFRRRYWKRRNRP